MRRSLYGLGVIFISFWTVLATGCSVVCCMFYLLYSIIVIIYDGFSFGLVAGSHSVFSIYL